MPPATGGEDEEDGFASVSIISPLTLGNGIIGPCPPLSAAAAAACCCIMAIMCGGNPNGGNPNGAKGKNGCIMAMGSNSPLRLCERERERERE